MCGVFGIFFRRPLTEADIELGRAATRELAHRGPDGGGEWLDRAAGVFIGHRRLAIVDLSEASSQPFVGDGSVLAFNGEIYNYRELGRSLASCGFPQRTTGDVEVLFKGWQAWGEEVLHRVDGMFATILWDGRQATLSVDPFGEKPLYWAETSDGIVVSSELPPLVRHFGLSSDLSGEKLFSFLSLGYVRAPHTAYRDTYRLLPGEIVSIRDGRVCGRRRYWVPPLPSAYHGPVKPLDERALDRIRDVLVEAVADRLQADVPVCLFLSAGVDSALVAALARKELGAVNPCITVSFPRGNVEDEAPYASEIAALLGLPHEIVESTEDSRVANVDRMLDLFGQPNENLTVFSIQRMTRAARRQFKTGMTGLGGDEVFFGYGKHEFFFRRRFFYRVPQSVRVTAGGVARSLAKGWPRLRHLRDLWAVPDSQLYLAHKNYPAIHWLQRQPGFSAWAEEALHSSAPVELSVPHFELADVMPGSYLTSNDHGSMRESFELRTPFLSRRLVEQVAEFDPRSFMAFGQKSVLRRLLLRYLPAEMVDQPKRGFVFPQDRFLGGLTSVPVVPGVSAESIAAAWGHRQRSDGWQRLAVRLAIAAGWTNRASSDLNAQAN